MVRIPRIMEYKLILKKFFLGFSEPEAQNGENRIHDESKMERKWKKII